MKNGLYKKYLNWKLGRIQERINNLEAEATNDREQYDARLRMIDEESKNSGGTISGGLVFLAGISEGAYRESERRIKRLRITQTKLLAKLT